MSQRYAHSNSRSNTHKPQMKFVPKNQNPSPNSLSDSLRRSSAGQPDATTSGVASASLSRDRVGEKGDWVPNREPSMASAGNFVNYLPQDEAVAAGIAGDGGLDPVESQAVVDLLNRELARLLKLEPRKFWREVAGDASLHEFLRSFLKFRSRWYDFPYRGSKGTDAGLIFGEFELSRRVFLLLYRISSNKDPGARASDSLSATDHAVLLQETKILDVPNLLDICAIYGRENEDLTNLLVENAVKAQPMIHYELSGVASHFLSIFHTMHQRCSSSLQALLSSQKHEENGSSKFMDDFLEVMDFVNDSIASMDAFVASYKPAAMFFSCPVELSDGNEELLTTLSRLHDSLIPSLQRGFRIIISGNDGIIRDVAVSLKMLSKRIVRFGWKLLDICYFSEEVFEGGTSIQGLTKMFPAKVEDPTIRADILVQTFRDINGVSLQVLEDQKGYTFLQSMEKDHNISSKLENLQSLGWVCLDDEQFQYLTGIMFSLTEAIPKKPSHGPVPMRSDHEEIDEGAAIMASKVSQVKDIFPDYGKGFISGCLEVYNQNPEEVIQRILEGTLHDDLRVLDTSLETLPVSASASTLSKKDKGKGILVEVESSPLGENTAAVSRESAVDRSSVSSAPAVGRFVRKPKDELPAHVTLDASDKIDDELKANLLSQYEYEDEYDDSFDDLGFSVGDSGPEENELLSDRVYSASGKSSETGISSQPSSSSKWGSRKKPQYYVKDGKNYSYKVAGAVAVANASEASLVTRAQSEQIYGLGRGGNHPLGAVKELDDYTEKTGFLEVDQMEGGGNGTGQRGRARGRGRHRESHEERNNDPDGAGVEGRGNMGNTRGRGRVGGGRNHNRRDRAMRKHLMGLGG